MMVEAFIEQKMDILEKLTTALRSHESSISRVRYRTNDQPQLHPALPDSQNPMTPNGGGCYQEQQDNPWYTVEKFGTLGCSYRIVRYTVGDYSGKMRGGGPSLLML